MRLVTLTTALLCLFTASCKKEVDIITTNNPNLVSSVQGNLELNLSLMKYLGDDFVYEGWLTSADMSSPLSIGTFSVPISKDNNPQSYFFNVDESLLISSDSFFISIEPKEDPIASPSNSVVLAGSFENGSADLSISPIGNFNPAQVSGCFFLRTPTDDIAGRSNGNDEFGVWYGRPGEPPSRGLYLPKLNKEDGWVYEGWIQEGSTLISSGKFSNKETPDYNAGTPLSFGGSVNIGPEIPGEDFLNRTEAAPSGVNFPIDIRGRNIFISIEPYPDNDLKELFTGCLIGFAPTGPLQEKYDFKEDLSFGPSGKAIIR